MTHPIIAQLYIDRQRQQTRLQDARKKLLDTVRAIRALEPRPEDYADQMAYVDALMQHNVWRTLVAYALKDMDAVAFAISESLSAPDAHLKGYPR
jgi:hypothetical protein